MEIFNPLNGTFGGNIEIIGDFNIRKYINFINVTEQSPIVLTLNNFCQFLSSNQFNLTKSIYGRIIDHVLANFNFNILCALERLVPIDPRHTPLHNRLKTI